ncbi:hypothetical protein BKA62DRAFT_429759 [Auriculariales sp. MPI-PUGE-AT-0066]|nr:hypothetical protein BKA62DRAFT_429759 [Auriculariales sp. MPI-PUGE-AT-0066]
MPARDSYPRRNDIDVGDLQRQVADIFDHVTPPGSHHAGPSRIVDSTDPLHSRKASHTHQRPILRIDSIDSLKTRDELERLLREVEDRLRAELARATEAEQRAREADSRAAALKVAHRKLDNETRAARETVKAYQIELRTAITQVEAGNSEIQRLARERDDADDAATRARSKARKVTEALQSERAREEGRREGIAMGRQEALRIVQVQGLPAPREGAPAPRDVSVPSAVPAPRRRSRREADPLDDLTSPVRSRRRRMAVTDVEDAGPSRPRKRSSSVTEAPAPAIPDYAPMARAMPRMTVTTPTAEVPEVSRVTSSPAVEKPARLKSPPSATGRARVVSAPINLERPITPVPIHNSDELHIHSPIHRLPDTYIPIIDENSEVPFPLPPPHELAGIPATPSVSSRALLPQVSSPTDAGSRASMPSAAGAAKAFGRGMKSIFKTAKRASGMGQDPNRPLVTSPVTISGPTGFVHEQGASRRPGLSVIIEGSQPVVPQVPIAQPMPVMSAPIAEPRRRPVTMQASMENGLQNWNAQQHHRQRMANELRNSDPDIASNSDFGFPTPKRRTESINSGTSYYHRHNRPKVKLPELLSPGNSTITHLQDQAEMIDSGMSVSSHSHQGHGEQPRTRTVSGVSSAGGGLRRKAPPEVRTSMFSPTNSHGPSGMPAPFGRPMSYGQPMSPSQLTSPGQPMSPPTRDERMSQVQPMSPHAYDRAAQQQVDISTPTPMHPLTHSRSRSGSVGGPAITVTRPRTRSPAPDLLDADRARDGHELRRSSSAASIGSQANSMRSKRSAYRPFTGEGYVDPASFATNFAANPFAPGSVGAAEFERSRPPSPATGTASNW